MEVDLISPAKRSPIKIESPACVFCFRETDNEDLYGKKLYYSGGYTHYFCMLFASGLVQQGPENKGCCGFMPYHLNKELRRGKNIICVFCEKGGATIGCCNKKCKNQWHFPCGLENGALNQYFDNFNSYCEEHRPRQNLHLFGELDRLCTICVSEVHGEVDSNESLRTPCCAKNTLYHRSCIQRYALSSALHHFKCPLCNNVKEFQKEMQKLGIYIPDQDAAWELEPNAYHELLERYDKCDTANCQCPEGRRYNNKRSKLWAIALCDVCGSSGIHLKCAGLKSAKNEWICPGCAEICPPSPEKKKKKTDLLSYEDWLASRFGRKRAASLEHDTPSKRRKRDVADYRTPRYVEIDLCLTGDCDNVPARMLRVKPKRQFKKGVVRSLNLGGTEYLDGLRFGDVYSDSSDSESDIFPSCYSINVRDLNIDLSRKPVRKITLNGESSTISGAIEDEMDPVKSYQAYKNYHRNLARSPSVSSLDTLDTVSVGNEPRHEPMGNVTFASQNKPSTSGANKPSTSAVTKSAQYDIVVISDDDDEEPFLDLTTTPDELERPQRPALPLVCDLTEDGNYDIFLNQEAVNPFTAAMPGAIATERKVQEWLEIGQGEPNRIAQSSLGFPSATDHVRDYSRNTAPQGMPTVSPALFGFTSLAANNASHTAVTSSAFFTSGNKASSTMRHSGAMMTQDIKKLVGISNPVATTTVVTTPIMTKDIKKLIGVPVATVLPMAQSRNERPISQAQMAAASSRINTNVPVTTAPPRCTCQHRHPTPGHLPQQINPCKVQPEPPSRTVHATNAGDSSTRSQKRPVDDSVIILD